MPNLKLAGYFFENCYVRNNDYAYGYLTLSRPTEYSEWDLLTGGRVKVYDWAILRRGYFSINHITK